MAATFTPPDDWIAFAALLADEAHAMAAAAAPDRIELKPDRSFVTGLDRAIERRLREMIADRFPDHGVIGEEEGPDRPDAEFVWSLDPVDGTAAFVAGVPVHGTLIALAAEGRSAIGIIDMHVGARRWLGATGRETVLNGAPCRTRRGAEMGRAILSCSNPDFFDEAERPALDRMRAATGWRVWGASCLAYGLLASGRTDIAMDAGFGVYDHAPFTPIIEGAGGVVTDWEGRPLTLSGGSRVLAAGDPALHRAALDVMNLS